MRQLWGQDKEADSTCCRSPLIETSSSGTINPSWQKADPWLPGRGGWALSWVKARTRNFRRCWIQAVVTWAYTVVKTHQSVH